MATDNPDQSLNSANRPVASSFGPAILDAIFNTMLNFKADD